MGFRAIVLWIHVLCGVLLVGACASFVIAAAALTSESGELGRLAVNTAPRINRIAALTALVIPLTGIGNLIYAARAHRNALPPEFIGLLAAKITLFAAIAAALAAAWRIGNAIGDEKACGAALMTNIRKLSRLYALIMGMGALALGLGVWLSGT